MKIFDDIVDARTEARQRGLDPKRIRLNARDRRRLLEWIQTKAPALLSDSYDDKILGMLIVPDNGVNRIVVEGNTLV